MQIGPRGVVQLEDGVDDPGAGDKPVDRGAAPASAPASTIVVRWWSEMPLGDDGDRAALDRATRGIIRDLNGHTLGAFGGFDALVALLHRLVSDARRRRG